MTPRLLALGKSPRMEILNRIKRSSGLSIQELSQSLAFSPAGLKQHCDALMEEGYLDTWRRSKTVGRPEKVYRLTRKAQTLFPNTTQGMTMDILRYATALYGPAAPEKLLFAWFEERREFYAKKVRGNSIEVRLNSLARLREEEGTLPIVEPAPWRLVEYHSPTAELRETYPLFTRYETELISAALDAPVQRREETVSGLFRCEFIPQ